MIVTGTDKVCGNIAKHFGIKNCQRININMEVNSVVKVIVEFYPEKEDIAEIGTMLTEYELVEKED